MESKNKTGFFAVLINELKNLLKNPKKLIPTFVLCGIWLVFSLMSGFGANIPILRFFYTLTYANGGMFGGFFGTVGGIFGKAVFAVVVNSIVLSICEKKNPFSGLKNGGKGIFTSGMKAIAPLFIGGGIGLVLYWFFNITSSPVNCAVAVVAALGALSAIGKKNGLLFSLVFSVMSKLSGGKTPSMTVVNRVITGFSLGFAAGLPITFARLPILLFLVGLLLLIAGIVLAIVGKNGTKKVAATVALVLLVGTLFSPAFTVNVSAAGLPEGFVEPAETLDFRSGINSALYGVENTNAVIFDPMGAESQLIKTLMSGKLKGCGEYEIMKMVPTYFDSLGSMIVNRNEKNDTVSITGKAACFHNGKESGWEEYEYNFSYTYELELYNFIFNDGEILVDVRGTETYSYAVQDPLGNYENDRGTIEIDNKQKSLYAYEDSETGKLMMTISVDDGYGGLVLVYTVEGILPVPGSASGGTGEDTREDTGSGDYVPYRGRLAYTSGRTNKYGQPFPDLMDFDGDGEITWADSAIQKELSHNPDYLDMPASPAAIAVIALITAILGGGGAVAASAAASVVSGIDDLGPNISRDEDGDLIVTDPVTGEKRLYKNNGDRTYTNPLTGATYTESELKSSLESHAENSGTLRQDATTAEEAIADQRKDNQELSDYAKKAAAENAVQRAKEAEEAKHREYVEKLGEKYDVYSGDEAALRGKIGEAQGKAEIEAYEYQEIEGEIKNKQEYVETVEKVADTSIDVLADVTGRKDIKAAYTMTKNTLARTSEAIANDKNVMVGMAQGAIEGTISVVQDNVDGAGAKLVANVVGETYKEAMDATINDKNMTEAVMGGIGKGLVNTGVDVGMDMVGEGAKELMGDAADEAIKNAFTEGAEVTKGSIVDGAKTLAGDLVKDGLE